MLDVTDNAWCWDGTSKYFGKFEGRATERFLAKNGGRTALGWYWYLAGDAALTVEPLDLFCSRLWSMGRLEIGIDKADRGAASEAFWALEYADSWKQLQGDTFYAWLTTHTSGDIVSIVKTLVGRATEDLVQSRWVLGDRVFPRGPAPGALEHCRGPVRSAGVPLGPLGIRIATYELGVCDV
jgi:hypothetical protein